MSELPDLFPGFLAHSVEVDGLRIFARSGGSGPPLLLLHGYPQTHICWHKVAPALAERYKVVIPDLRGYGESSCPEFSGDDAMPYSKRAMAQDAIKLMQVLGYTRFAICGHDRGARVAYRLALDHPQIVTRLAVLDILPTAEVWRRLTAESAIAAYHWMFLAQPAPMPETLIAANARFYVDRTLASWTKDNSLSAFDPVALAHYRQNLQSTEHIRAVCEDYRAGATIDRKLDEADLATGNTIASPAMVLWGTSYVGKGAESPLDIWRPWCRNVEGREIESGHFLAEENPGATLTALLEFLE